MPTTTLSWEDYRDKANKLKADGIRPKQIKEQLGDPFWDGVPYHIQSDGKGGISRKKLSTRQDSHKKSNALRDENLKLSTPENVDQGGVKRIAEEIKSQGFELDHIVEVNRSGNAIRDFGDDRQRIDQYKRNIKPGHQPSNLQGLSQKDNSQKNRDYNKLDKAIKSLENIPTLLQIIQNQVDNARGIASVFELQGSSLEQAADVSRSTFQRREAGADVARKEGGLMGMPDFGITESLAGFSLIDGKRQDVMRKRHLL